MTPLTPQIFSDLRRTKKNPVFFVSYRTWDSMLIDKEFQSFVDPINKLNEIKKTGQVGDCLGVPIFTDMYWEEPVTRPGEYWVMEAVDFHRAMSRRVKTIDEFRAELLFILREPVTA